VDARTRILAGAMALVESKGIGFSVDDLAAYIGASKKTIYLHFSKKEEILEKIINSLFDDIHAQQETISRNPDGSDAERFAAMLTLMPRRARKLDYALGFELRRTYPALHELVERRLAEGWEAPLSVLDRGMASGEFRTMDARVLKEMLLATMRSIMSDGFLAESDLSYSSAFGEVIRIVLEGILARPEAERRG